MINSQAIYLCYSYNTNINSNPFFICKQFASLDLAKKQEECLKQPYQSNQLNPSNQSIQSSSIISVCKYIPQPLHIFVLRYKLSRHIFGIKIY
jgi:hypothetical protein